MFGLDSRHILHILGDGGGKHNVSVYVDVVMAKQPIVGTIILIGMMDGQHSAFIDGGGILLLAELKGGGRSAELLDEGGHTGSFHYARTVAEELKKVKDYSASKSLQESLICFGVIFLLTVLSRISVKSDKHLLNLTLWVDDTIES
jgi:hypothetical protein